ncbi:hypothetical protein RB25_09490 [Herbaspirillum rubrisubalbicans]|jgi:hypothetical protein|uniref:(S)-ureidoglycine aminohydrolase cupin domain-containing protein n=2 Tax=Herbaspirillum rubrisubalbicans TaxID=80842 RepID=A0ABX9C488_9BURK|nr:MULTISPECIES: cupin domain-containing protein [Herbaspirillum]MCP1576262.1 putative cupin superfamily protein [Herbaspirillum rubrisubalbicans]NQE50151.1 hypothetical protein [Herbaspirillum rubrisubalbicans]QJP99508.1 DUF861 domain-containing protein [Herbaspirillum rubrisubalbicans Os34]RAM65344.1 hypothetical protein RB24_08585 [Herbaspirillum rubrisubalbicans]RAN48976.1 hypothetical protein RB25_09490 [Herbaspirillum rubrisubalbicans]
MNIIEISHAPRREDMQAIGPVSVLGATIEAGEAQAYATGTFGAPGDAVSAGYFGVTRSTFRMTYPFNEQATVAEGSVRLTDLATGNSLSFGKGDSWFVKQGSEILWEIQSDFFVKHFFAVANP